MKYFVILPFIAILFIPQAFAEESFDGHSSIDPPLSKIISGQSTVMNIRIWYTSGPYAMNDFAPIIEVNPPSAGKFVQVDVESIEITQGQIARIPVTFTVDPQISNDKIFLGISFSGHHFITGELQKSSWNDQIVLDVVTEKPVPEPEHSTDYENCGVGTTLQNGLCVVDNPQQTTNSSEKWPTPYQKTNAMVGSIMNVSDNIISPEQTMLVSGIFDQYAGNFNANVFKDYPDSRELVLTMTHTTNEFGYFTFNFTIPQFWNLGNYHIVLENGNEEMSWHFTVRKNHAGGTLDRTVYPITWELSPLKQFKAGAPSNEVQCKENLILVQKHDDSPACIKESSINKLINRGWTNLLPRTCPTGFSYNQVLFKCVVSCKDGLVYNGYTNSCTTEFELKYHGFCNEGFVYDVSSHMCYSGDSQQVPLKDPPRTPPPEPESQPEPMSDDEMQLYNARKSLEDAYQNQVNLGQYYMKDVIVGFGTYDNTLIIDIPSKYTDQNSIQIIKKEIRHIVGDQVNIDYAIYDEPVEKHIATVIPYLWNKILHQKKIDFAPKEMSYFNNADGFAQHDRVCSPLVAPNGTEFYISSTFDFEPFEITGTFIDKTEPDDCHKIWKTDVIMAEPDRVTALWLKNEN